VEGNVMRVEPADLLTPQVTAVGYSNL